jgi:hypothetical protein
MDSQSWSDACYRFNSAATAAAQLALCMMIYNKEITGFSKKAELFAKIGRLAAPVQASTAQVWLTWQSSPYQSAPLLFEE